MRRYREVVGHLGGKESYTFYFRTGWYWRLGDVVLISRAPHVSSYTISVKQIIRIMGFLSHIKIR